MADGRMLKRAVSDSKKLSELKTDSARLLWTWILPYLDIEGRYFADPDLIKGKIVPRLKTFTPDLISGYLEDMNRVGLIQLYESDGEKYLQFRNFHLFQKLRKDKEAESKIPTPDLLPTYSGLTPPQDKIREVKISKANRDQLPAVDNSEKPKDAFLINLKELLEKTKDKYPTPHEQQAIILFVQSNIRRNPNAIAHCINSLIKAPDKVRAVQNYLEAALKIEDGNYNARDSEARCNSFKKMDLTPISSLLTGILKTAEEH